MRRNLVIGLSSVALFIGATALGASAQDLGSSNKLFGGSSTSKKPAQKKAPAKKPTAQKPTTQKATTKATAKKVAPKTKQKAVTPAKPTAKTATKPTNVKTVVTAAKPSTDIKPVIAPKAEVKKDDGPKVIIHSGTIPIKTAKNEIVDDSKYEQLIEEGNAGRDDRDYSAAEAAYTAAAKRNPRDARAFLGIGNLYADQQRWEDAEKAYRSAIAIDREYAELLTALSFVLTRPLSSPNLSERYTEAATLARSAIKMDPKSWLAYDQLGVSLELLGEIGAETENAYRRSIELERDFAPAYAHLARLLKKKGRTAESVTNYNHATYKATAVGTKLLVVDAMHTDNKFAESVPILSIALLMDPRNPTALSMLGRAQTVLGNYPDAEKNLKKSIEIAPAGVISYSLLAALYIKQQRPELAENILVRSIQYLTPFEKRRIASQFENLGDAYFKTMGYSNAIAAYKRSGELDPDRVSIAGKIARSK